MSIGRRKKIENRPERRAKQRLPEPPRTREEERPLYAGDQPVNLPRLVHVNITVLPNLREILNAYGQDSFGRRHDSYKLVSAQRRSIENLVRPAP